MSDELTLAYAARTYSSGNRGRAICNARQHHWIADDTGGEAVGAGELLCAGITACAVNMVERIATAEEKPLGRMNVVAEAYRNKSNPASAGDYSIYDAIRVNFEFWGVGDEDAEYLVETWKRR